MKAKTPHAAVPAMRLLWRRQVMVVANGKQRSFSERRSATGRAAKTVAFISSSNNHHTRIVSSQTVVNYNEVTPTQVNQEDFPRVLCEWRAQNKSLKTSCFRDPRTCTWKGHRLRPYNVTSARTDGTGVATCLIAGKASGSYKRAMILAIYALSTGMEWAPCCVAHACLPLWY